MTREAHFKQNIWFHKDESGKPIWKDTYVYAVTEGDWLWKRYEHNRDAYTDVKTDFISRWTAEARKESSPVVLVELLVRRDL